MPIKLIFDKFQYMGEKEIVFYLLNTSNHSQVHALDTPSTLEIEMKDVLMISIKCKIFHSSNYAKKINPKFRDHVKSFCFYFKNAMK